MGVPQTPQEAAPAYDDVFHDHPVNRFAPSGSTSTYAAVPQADDSDIELHAHTHTPPSSTAPTEHNQETFAQTIAGVLRPKAEPHTHCEQCDVQLAAREEREKYCCTMVAATFMTLFVCGMLLGIVVVDAMARKRRSGGE